MFSKKSLSNQQPYLPCMLKMVDCERKVYLTNIFIDLFVGNGRFYEKKSIQLAVCSHDMLKTVDFFVYQQLT